MVRDGFPKSQTRRLKKSAEKVSGGEFCISGKLQSGHNSIFETSHNRAIGNFYCPQKMLPILSIYDTAKASLCPYNPAFSAQRKDFKQQLFWHFLVSTLRKPPRWADCGQIDEKIPLSWFPVSLSVFQSSQFHMRKVSYDAKGAWKSNFYGHKSVW